MVENADHCGALISQDGADCKRHTSGYRKIRRVTLLLGNVRTSGRIELLIDSAHFLGSWNN